MMQYDVKAAKLTQSGWFLPNGQQIRTRLKQITYVPNGSQSGSVKFFDTLVVPTAGTYSRSGYTVTVTATAHGLSTGDTVGIAYNTSSGAAATDGNYTITKTGADTFTIQDVNTGTVGGSPPACYYVKAYASGTTANVPQQRWIASFDTYSGQTNSQQVIIPGEGVLTQNGIYVVMTNTVSCSIFYG
jgi:hypothetical protein